MSDSGDIFQIAVVGHTNAGKTSLMRTLSRDAGFGEVSPSPATTREVTSISLLADGAPQADFRDTPGLEDSIGLLELVDRMRTDRRDDGPSLIERFLGSMEANDRYSQEAKALRQARIADLVLYVNGLPIGVIELKNPTDDDATGKAMVAKFRSKKGKIGKRLHIEHDPEDIRAVAGTREDVLANIMAVRHSWKAPSQIWWRLAYSAAAKMEGARAASRRTDAEAQVVLAHRRHRPTQRWAT